MRGSVAMISCFLSVAALAQLLTRHPWSALFRSKAERGRCDTVPRGDSLPVGHKVGRACFLEKMLGGGQATEGGGAQGARRSTIRGSPALNTNETW